MLIWKTERKERGKEGRELNRVIGGEGDSRRQHESEPEGRERHTDSIFCWLIPQASRSLDYT